MGLRIMYGKSGCGKSEYCFKEIAKLIKKEKKIYIITPEQFSFTAEKKLMEAIDTNAVINAEVITLSRMAHRVLQEIGGSKQTQLTKCGKSMLIYSILNQYKKDLKFLSKSDENIDLSMTAITEFKKHGVKPENLQEEIEKVQDEYLKTKLKDMLLIYQNFEQKLKGEYIEDTDLLTLLSQNIENTDLVKDSLIYIDEFAGFTYQEYEILKKFIKLAKQVTITVCTDSLEPSLKPDTDIFYSNKITVSKILNLAKEENLKLEQPIFLKEQPRFKSEELQHLEKNIFNTRAKKYEKESQNIKLFLAKNQYSEIENVAKEITKLVRDKNLRYKDISVITKNIDTYSSLVRSIFAEYDIPVFIDEKRDLNQNIIVQYLLSIFEIFSNNFSKEAVFNYLKIGFSEIEEDDIFKLENYCTKWGIKQNKWKNDFTYGIKDETKEEIEYLNKLRKQIIEPLLELKKKFRTVKETTKAIYEFLQEQNIEEKINYKINELQEIGQLDIANEYIASYKIILDIFDEMVLIFGNEKLSIEKYMQILKTGLKNSELGKIPGTQDQVIVGDVDRSRSHKVDTIFIIGLNDGSFPSINKSEGFFGDKDREILKNDGIELANGTIENLYEENFNIYKAFTTAENRLYLSYASSETEGKSLRPSMMVNKIKKIFPELKEESDVINKNYEITNKMMTYQELLENISSLKESQKIEDIWYTVYQYYKNQNEYNIRLLKDLKGIDYTNLPESIKKETIEKLYGNTLNTSVSKLERFAQCPFSYYLQYGLKLKEKEELKIQSFDTGSFMHETIDEFFKKVKNENINLAELVTDEEKIQELVNKVIEEKLDMGKKYTFVATSKYKVLVNRLKRIVAKALKYIIEGLVYSEFDIEGTEIEFGKKGKYKPILIQLDDGKKVEITGKIDRIDTATSDDGKYLRIIDYKSSAKNIDLNEVYAGLQIQLLTYMDAVCKEEDLMPAGVLYFSLLEQMIKADKRISEEQIEEELRKNFKMKGLILADVKVIQMHDKNLKQGTSKLIPATLTKTGEISEGKTNGVNKEEFEILQNYIYKTIRQISKEILSGNIALKPYNKNGKKPCEYCSYKAICGFNPRLCGNNYNYIDKKSKDDIIRKMSQAGRFLMDKNVPIGTDLFGTFPKKNYKIGRKKLKNLSNENVIHIIKDGVQYFQFRKLLEYDNIITHAYSLGTDLNFRTAMANKEALPQNEYNKAIDSYKKICNSLGTDYKNIVKTNQEHTDNIKIIKEKINKEFMDINLEEYKETDGMITNKQKLMLSTTNADCILLLFFDPVTKTIANVHSGWKGTLQRISAKTVEKMQKEFNCRPENIICCICPSIRKCHFEVDKDVKEMFEKEFKDLQISNSIDIMEKKQIHEKWNIDTVFINKIILEQKGLKPENIIDSEICSVCNSDLIHSYRVEKQGYGLNTALISLK